MAVTARGLGLTQGLATGLFRLEWTGPVSRLGFSSVRWSGVISGGVILCRLIFAAALLSSSVGHAGASGYLAAMALCGVAPGVMKPTALVLNVLVATIATVLSRGR
jgi:hypothetical protein